MRIDFLNTEKLPRNTHRRVVTIIVIVIIIKQKYIRVQ